MSRTDPITGQAWFEPDLGMGHLVSFGVHWTNCNHDPKPVLTNLAQLVIVTHMVDDIHVTCWERVMTTD